MKSLLQSLRFTIVLFVLCGVIYPLAVNIIGHIFFPKQAQGSLVYLNKKVIGSKYIAQPFLENEFFHSRPSFINYSMSSDRDAQNSPRSGGSNYSFSNPLFQKEIEMNIKQLLKENEGLKKEDIPADLVTSSGSGLDPDISFKAAEIQIQHVAKYSGLGVGIIKQMVVVNTHHQIVNVLLLNRAVKKAMEK